MIIKKKKELPLNKLKNQKYDSHYNSNVNRDFSEDESMKDKKSMFLTGIGDDISVILQT
jgi:hypothetical protein